MVVAVLGKLWSDFMNVTHNFRLVLTLSVRVRVDVNLTMNNKLFSHGLALVTPDRYPPAKFGLTFIFNIAGIEIVNTINTYYNSLSKSCESLRLTAVSQG